MKTSLLFVLLPVAVAIVGAAGCARSRGDDQATPVEPPPAAVYKPGHGVQLSAPAQTFVGLVTAEVEQRAAGNGEEILLPIDALLRTARGDFVYVGNGDWLLRTPVTVGLVDGATVQIVDGLYEGDTVVVQGVRALALAEMQALNGGVGCADGH